MKIRRMFFCAVFLAMLFNTASATQETLIQSIALHHEFFIKLRGYSDHLLSDVEIIERDKSLGVILISPEGFEEQLAFDVASMNVIYADYRILSKDAREFLKETSIHMSEVRKLARAVKNRIEEMRQGWKLYEGKPGNIIPESSSTDTVEPNQFSDPVISAEVQENQKSNENNDYRLSDETNRKFIAMSEVAGKR